MSTSITRVSEAPVLAVPSAPRPLFHAIGSLYCRLFHNAISRPVGGKYRCWKCLREFELEW